MVVEKEQINKFMEYAARVKNSVLYPALDCILIESTGNEIRFTKTNNYIYCRYEYASSQPIESVLIDEKQIIGFLTVCDSEEIRIDEAIDRTFIVGGSKNAHCAPRDVKQFPVMPEYKTEELSALSCANELKVAGRYLIQNKIKRPIDYVHAGPNGIFATNGSMVYYNNKPSPVMFLDPEVLGTLGEVEQVDYFNCGNYDFFDSNKVLFGFIQTNITEVNYQHFIKKAEGEKFTVSKKDLIDFCVLVEYSAKNENPIAKFQNGLDLFYEDSDFNNGAAYTINCEGFATEPFTFSVNAFKAALIALPYQQLTFTKFDKHYQLTSQEDAGYVGVIGGRV